LLSEHPGSLEPRELLESCPMHGTLLLVARELAREGDAARAERAARRAAEVLGPTPTVCAVLADVLALLGKDQQARLLREQAIGKLLGPA
jgi:Flp pilus assembly protein TadD